MNKFKEKVFYIIEPADAPGISQAYDAVMLIAIVVSIIPLCVKSHPPVFDIIDTIATVLFIIDYLMRWFTSDLKQNKTGAMPYIKYPFTFAAIIDLLSILPFFFAVNKSLRLLRLFRASRLLKMFRIFKAMRYSKSVSLLFDVIKEQKDLLIAVCIIAGGYILISALVIFNIEPETFEYFFEAIYWATVSLTTVGYGDIYPVSAAGRIITMISSFFGIAVVAMPAGIITAGFMDKIEKRAKEDTNGHS